MSLNFIQSGLGVAVNCRELLSKVDAYLEHEELIEHTFHVFALCVAFVKLIGEHKLDVNSELLLFSAILHDIAKQINEEGHNRKKYVKEALKKADIDIDPSYDEGMFYIFEAHKGSFIPPSEVALGSAFLRLCDKLVRLRKRKKDAGKKVHESLREIHGYFADKNLQDEWTKLERACSEIRGFISY